MSCNCKATHYVRTAKREYGFEPETKETVSTKEKVKMFFQAVLIWLVMLIGFPFALLYIIFSKTFARKKSKSFFKAIKIRF